jgi:3-oxoacyl-[acyl-carrier protein] reductase
MSKKLVGKTAFITGASNGIGAATARMLADEGAQVIIGYNNGIKRANALLTELCGDHHSIQQLTLEDSLSVKRAANNIKKNHPKLDILVNSAGFTKPIPHDDLEALDDNFMDKMLIANVRGPFSVIRELRPLLKAGGESVIINLSSVSGFKGTGSSIAYVACKAAIDTMSLALARVLGPEIRVNCISPGAVATDFVAGRDRKKLKKLAESSPLQKIVDPEDVALAIMAYITHLKHSTGARIIVDSGKFLK